MPTIGAAYFFYFIAGLGAIPFWLWLGRQIGKHRAFMCTLITVATVSGANLLLSYGDYLPFFLLFIVNVITSYSIHYTKLYEPPDPSPKGGSPHHLLF